MPSGEIRIQGAELTFSQVSRHHSGTYECVAQNELGAARTAVSLVVSRKYISEYIDKISISVAIIYVI